MAFHHKVHIVVVVDHGGDLAQHRIGRLINPGAARLEQELVRNRNVHKTALDFYLYILVIDVAQRTFEVHHQRQVEAVFRLDLGGKVLDEGVLLSDVFQRLLDAFRSILIDDRQVGHSVQQAALCALSQVELFFQLSDLFVFQGELAFQCGHLFFVAGAKGQQRCAK